MSNMRMVDMHCDTLLEMRGSKTGFDNAPGHINIDKLRRGGALLQCFAIYTPTHDEAAEYNISGTSWEYYNEALTRFQNELKKCPDSLRQMRTMDEFRANSAAGMISALLTLEDGDCIDGRIERVQTLFDDGVRMVALTWNYENSIGFPNSFEPALHAKGLKEFGFEVVSEMNRLGMIVDVSHLSEGGFYDVARVSKKPFLASHSCARALCDHSRCLTDEQLKTLGDCGGVCGVNFYSRFLRRDSDYTSNEDILRHMEYIADKAGMDAVALGSDFDGIDCELEMKDYSGMALLSELIADRFGSDNADRICFANALRVFSENIG